MGRTVKTKNLEMPDVIDAGREALDRLSTFFGDRSRKNFEKAINGFKNTRGINEIIDVFNEFTHALRGASDNSLVLSSIELLFQLRRSPHVAHAVFESAASLSLHGYDTEKLASFIHLLRSAGDDPDRIDSVAKEIAQAAAYREPNSEDITVHIARLQRSINADKAES